MAKYIGTGTKLEYENPADQWNEITCLQSIQPPGIEYDTVETELCLNDTTSTASEVSSGDPVTSEVPFTAYLDPGDVEHKALEDLAKSQATVNWRITYPNASVQAFPGFLRSYVTQTISRRDYIMADGVIVRTGDITYTP